MKPYTNITRTKVWCALHKAGLAQAEPHPRRALRAVTIAAAFAAMAAMAGCANLPPASAYGYAQANSQQVQQVQLGTVLAALPVRIQPTTSGIGPLAGLAAGGALGHQVGNGNGRIAATIIGAIAGSIAGNRAEAAATQASGEQVTVKLQSGQVIAVTQASDVPLSIGEQVQVVGGGWGQPARVLPIDQGAAK